MRVFIVHNTLNSVGGGERVCLAFIEAIKSLGHEVTLITTEATDWKRVEKIIGTIVKPEREVYLVPFKVKAFGIYTRLLITFLLAREKKKCDLVINSLTAPEIFILGTMGTSFNISAEITEAGAETLTNIPVYLDIYY